MYINKPPYTIMRSSVHVFYPKITINRLFVLYYFGDGSNYHGHSYTLNGTPATVSTRGIVIMNGKKIIRYP